MWITWSFPIFILVVATALAIPVGLYMAWLFEGKCRLPRWLSWLEQRIDTGPQNWKQYLLAFMVFNVVTFVVGYIVLVAQPWHGDFLNPDHKGALAPTTIFNTVTSFLTNTNLQDYSGEVHLSYGSQLFFICWKQILSPIIGVCVLLAIIRGLRGDKHMGNFYLDMWRGVVYFYLPLCLVVAWLLVAAGTPMTMQPNAPVTTLDVDANGQPQTQSIARGPVAAIVSVKQFGHQRRRLLRRQLRPPVREPQRLDQHHRVRRHHPRADRLSGDVRNHAQKLAARRRHLRRDAPAVGGHHRLGDRVRPA